jgi:hypothetical protein
MYPDNSRSYPSAFRYYRSDGTVADAIPRTKQTEEGDVDDQDNGGDEGESALF